MSIIEFGLYALIWTVVSTGLTFVIAAAFFGCAAKEISEEEYNDLPKRR